MAQLSLRLLPPLSCFAGMFRNSYKSIVVTISSKCRLISLMESPFIRAINCKFSLTVSCSKNELNWGHIPILWPLFDKSMCLIFYPIKWMLPKDRGSCIAITLKVDDFPAPLGPSNPMVYPRLTPKLTPPTA